MIAVIPSPSQQYSQSSSRLFPWTSSCLVQLLLLPIGLLLMLLNNRCRAISPTLFMDRHGCGEAKGCLFKPAGCNPMLDCSIAIIFNVSGRNKLTVQMAAQSLVPAPSLQYVAIGFSHDMIMGDDFVTECVLSPDGSSFNDIEVFTSYNLDRTSNDRTWLNMTERYLLYDRVEGEVVDGRLYCSFVQTIRPQFSLSYGFADRVWNLDTKYWIMGATGSAQPDEINAHDTSLGSHFYPILSSRAIDPSRVGARYYELPSPYALPKGKAASAAAAPETAKVENMAAAPVVQEMRSKSSRKESTMRTISNDSSSKNRDESERKEATEQGKSGTAGHPATPSSAASRRLRTPQQLLISLTSLLLLLWCSGIISS